MEETRLDPNRFKVFLQKLKAIIPRGAPDIDSPQILNAWYQALYDLSIDELTVAYRSLVSSEDWFPSVAKIRKLCIEARIGVVGSRFDEVIKLASNADSKHIKCDEVLARVINRFGGLHHISKWWDEKDYSFRKKEFDAFYEEELSNYAAGHYKHSDLPKIGYCISGTIDPNRKLLNASSEPEKNNSMSYIPKEDSAQGGAKKSSSSLRDMINEFAKQGGLRDRIIQKPAEKSGAKEGGGIPEERKLKLVNE